MIDLSPIEVEATKEHQWTIVWLHGLGADGHDVVPVAKAMGLESALCIPERANRPRHSITEKMRSWYDIVTRVPDRESYDMSFAQPKHGRPHWNRRRASRGTERIFLAGFSQGGAMTYHHGMRTKEPWQDSSVGAPIS